MKKTEYFYFVTLALLLAGVFIFVGCSSDEEIYNVTVTNGSGSGKYPAGIKVRITAAQAPSEDQAFKNWTASPDVTFSDTFSSRASFTMPASEVTITAIYDTAHTLTVSGGTGSGKYAAGATVAVTANVSSNNHFLKWKSDDGVVFTGAEKVNTTFTMPASDVNVSAEMLYRFLRTWGWVPGFWTSGTGIGYNTEYGWGAQKCYLVDDDGLLAIGPRTNHLWQLMTTEENLNFNEDNVKGTLFVIKNLHTGRFINVKNISSVATTDAVNGFQVKVSDLEDDPAFYWGFSPARVDDIEMNNTIINSNIFNGTAEDGGMLCILGDLSNNTMKPSGNDSRLWAVQFLHARGSVTDDMWQGMFDRTQVIQGPPFPSFSTIYAFGIW